MELKNIVLPEDHGFDEKHLKFLAALDGALEKSKEGISKKEDVAKVKSDLEKELAEMKSQINYEKIQGQLNDIYTKMADRPAFTEKDKETQARIKNSQWLRAFLKKDVQTMKEMQTKETQLFVYPQHVLHTGDNALIDDGDMGQGGHLIPLLLEGEINKWAQEAGIARREMKYMPFGGAGNTRKHLFEASGVSVDWVNEGEIKPKTKPTFSYVNQTLRTVAGIVIMSEEVIEDSAIDLIAYCSQALGEAIVMEEDVQFFTGVGAPWTGIINAAGIVPVGLPVGNVNAADVRPEDFLAATIAIPVDAARGAKFYMHRTVYAALRAYRADAVAAGDGAGNYLVQDPTGSAPALLWGYPIVLADVLPDVATAAGAGTPFAIFANLKRTSVYGDKKGLRVKLLDQATVTDANGNLVNLAEQDMFALRVHKRVGYVNVLPSGIAVLETGPVT